MGAGGRWGPPKALHPSTVPPHCCFFFFSLHSSPPISNNLSPSFDFLSPSCRSTMAIPTNLLGCAVVAVDGSEESMRALNWALDNLRLRPGSSAAEGGSIVVVHVQAPPSIAVGINPGSIPFGGPSMEVPAFTAAIEAHQRRITEVILNRALEICAERNVNVKTEVVIGDPKEKICEVVDNLCADLLVMGSRAFGRFKRFFLGSVSKYCSKHASCPVVIIKGESREVVQAGITS